MFKIEIEQDDELMDLVALMARHLGATFTEKVTIETDNRRLAFGLAGMVGGVVEGNQPSYFMPEMHISKEDSRRIEQAVMAAVEEVRELPRNDANEETVSTETLAPHTNGKSVEVKEKRTSPGKKTGFCRYCGVETKTRAVVCEKKECKKKQTQEWAERYADKRKARKAAGLVGQAEPAAEPAEAADTQVPAGEPPFLAGQPATAPMYRVPTPEGLRAMTFAEMMLANQAGTVANGTRVQALPSGRYYVVQNGNLRGLVELEAEAAVPGPEATR